MLRSPSTSYDLHREIDWKRCGQIEQGNTAFGSTINSVSVLNGEMGMPTTSKSRTITRRASAKSALKRIPPVHPGEMLREEFLIPLGLSANALALAISVPATRIGEIVNERRGITGDTAIRLGEYFRTGPEFWINLQGRYELELARDAHAAAGIGKIEPAPVDESGMLLARSA
jgi:addiction module HigA family antidote